MEAQKSHFNRNLLIVLAVLYALSMAGFFYFSLSSNGEGMPWWMALLNALILSIPLVLIFGAIYVLVRARREYALSGKVSGGWEGSSTGRRVWQPSLSSSSSACSPSMCSRSSSALENWGVFNAQPPFDHHAGAAVLRLEASRSGVLGIFGSGGGVCHFLRAQSLCSSKSAAVCIPHLARGGAVLCQLEIKS